MIDDMTQEDGILLVREARRVVTDLVSSGVRPAPNDTFESRFAHPYGVFVTITKHDKLRGCIGYTHPGTSLAKSLSDAAVCAATEDPRFEPLTKDELSKVRFEVTILTAPQEITVDDPVRYPSHIQVGRDGLIVEMDTHSGLLLPQVAVQYGWSPEEFLSYTCEKAGLDKDVWRTGKAAISKFQGKIFAES